MPKRRLEVENDSSSESDWLPDCSSDEDEDEILPLKLHESLDRQLSKTRAKPAHRVFVTPVSKPKITTRASKKAKLCVPPIKVECWRDILNLARLCASNTHLVYQDCQSLPAVLPVLEEIDSMVGMDSIKETLCNHILFHASVASGHLKTPSLKHMVIFGEPGTGKTTLARLIARLHNRMGLLKTDKIVIARSEDLKGMYVGHTAPKVEKMVQKALDGVLLIDEAYTIGTGASSGDTFSEELVNALNEALSLHGDRFICILAGYKEAINQNLFAHNPGLSRRFPWVFEIPKSTPEQLSAIFHSMLAKENMSAELNVGNKQWFSERDLRFKYGGGSIQNLISKVKIAYARRMFGQEKQTQCTISSQDLKAGFAMYMSHDHAQVSEQNQVEHLSMYS